MPLLETGTDGCYKMGLSQGLDLQSLNVKRKFRWLFSIPTVAVNGVSTLPPKRSARPGFQVKEFDFQHLSETIYYPLKLEWKTINIVLYDILCNQNPVFDWLMGLFQYEPDRGFSDVTFHKVGDPNPINDGNFKRDCTLELYDGCGNIMEQWVYENAYPISVDWGELDMDSSEIVMADLTLRYDRAYLRQTPQ